MQMQKTELEEILKDNKPTFVKVSSSRLANIMQYVGVELKIDKYSLDYFYEINVEDLLKSQIPPKDIEEMASEGWCFDETKKFIKIFLTN